MGIDAPLSAICDPGLALVAEERSRHPEVTSPTSNQERQMSVLLPLRRKTESAGCIQGTIPTVTWRFDSDLPDFEGPESHVPPPPGAEQK